MRQLSPAFIVTSLALALASSSALAQVSRARNTSPSTATTTANVAPSGNDVSKSDTGTGVNGMAPGVIVPGIAAVTGIVEPGTTTNDELTARQGMAKEQRRRARGEEPRVYGIAPRTDRDLTNQIPDDPIIRY